MTFVIGQKAANRKLPADDIMQADIDAGLTGAAMGRKYGVSDVAVNAHIRKMGMRPAPEPASVKSLASNEPVATPFKIVTRKTVMLEGRDFRMAEILITLPRIPTLHGHFQGAML